MATQLQSAHIGNKAEIPSYNQYNSQAHYRIRMIGLTYPGFKDIE